MVKKIKVHVSVYEEETMTATKDKLSKELRIVAKPVFPKIDAKHTEGEVLDVLKQALSRQKYKDVYFKVKGLK